MATSAYPTNFGRAWAFAFQIQHLSTSVKEEKIRSFCQNMVKTLPKPGELSLEDRPLFDCKQPVIAAVINIIVCTERR